MSGSGWDNPEADIIGDIRAMKAQIQDVGYKPDPYRISGAEIEAAAEELHAKVMAEIVMRQTSANDYGLRLAQVAKRWILYERFEQ